MLKIIITQGGTTALFDPGVPLVINVTDVVPPSPTPSPSNTKPLPTPSPTPSKSKPLPTPSPSPSNSKPLPTPTSTASHTPAPTPSNTASNTPVPTPTATSSGNPIDAMYPSTFRLSSVIQAFTQPPMTVPAKAAGLGSVYTDPVFGTKIAKATALTDISDSASSIRHDYSRRQAFNADSTRYIASANGWWYLYDANTFQRLDAGRTSTPGLGAIPGMAGDCEAIWHPTDPTKLWHTDNNGGLVWSEYNTATKTTSTLFDLTSKLQALGWTTAARTWTKSEGRPSNDGRYFALLVQKSNFDLIGFIMYDRQTDTIIGHMECTNMPDHISTSPLGNYAVISWYGNAYSSLTAAAAVPVQQVSAGVRAYSRDFSSFKQLAVLGEHSDLAIDAAGNEVFVMITYHGQADGATDGAVFYRIIATGQAYSLPINFYGGSTGASVHISGTATNKPGWIVMEKYSGVGSGAYDGQVVAVQLIPSGQKVYHLAHHRTNDSTYFAEPQATVNRDFTRVVFATDWNGTTPPTDFHILLPSWALN